VLPTQDFSTTGDVEASCNCSCLALAVHAITLPVLTLVHQAHCTGAEYAGANATASIAQTPKEPPLPRMPVSPAPATPKVLPFAFIALPFELLTVSA